MQSIINIKSLLATMTFLAIGSLTLNCAAMGSDIESIQHIGKTVYNLLDAKGQSTSTQARCATASSSGLTWELKTDDGGIHDQDNVYRWGGAGAEKTGTIFFADWDNLINATNTEKLCGFNDWRAPTIDELKTLVINAHQKPVIDIHIFSLTQAAPYWSVSTYLNYPEHAQTVDFATGASHYYNGFRGDRLPLRLVRGKQK